MNTGRWLAGRWLFFKQQMKIIEIIHAHGSLKSGYVMRLYGISRQAAGKELAQMVEQNLIRT